MATYVSNSTPPAVWSFFNNSDPYNSYDPVNSTSTRLVYLSGSGTKTFINGTGLSVNGIGNISWTSLSSIQYVSSDGGTVYQQITGMTVQSPGSSEPRFLLPTVLAGADTITGSSGDDVMFGYEGANQFSMGAGADSATGGSGDDLFRVLAGDWVTNTGSGSFDAVGGGVGADTLRLESVGSITIGASQMQAVENLAFEGNATTTVTISGLDLRGGGSGLTTFTGSSGSDNLIFQSVATSDLSVFAFNNWNNAQDTITIFAGIGGGSPWTGTNYNDIFSVAAGANNGSLFGGGGDDLFLITGANGSFVVDGGAGTNDVMRLDSATVDMTGIFAPWGANLEKIQYSNGASKITFRNEAVTSAFPTVVGGAQLDTFEILVYANVDFSTLSFQSWSANDQIIISDGVNGAFANSITGTAQADIIKSNGGADTLAGGAGSDTYEVWTGTIITESANGGSADRARANQNFTLNTGSHVEVLETINVASVNGLSLTGNELAQTIIGNAGNDALSGAGGNDILQGLGGTNTLTGGGGWDRANYAIASGAATITHNANGTTTIAGAGFSDTLTGVEVAHFTDKDVAIREVARGDFNGEGTSDLVLQSGGTVVDWIMQNGAYQAGNVLTTGATGFTVVGKGDFNGDGTADLALQSGGTVVDWIMQNGAYAAGNVITTGASGYTVVASGDLNGDGTTDLVLQNGGTVVDWIMQNGVYQSGGVLTTGASGYTVVGSGDLNGDGTADLVLQNGGTVVDWIMKNGVYQSGNVVTTGAAGFNVVGVGDVNGDGTADIVLQNGGTVVDWIMKNGVYQSGNVVTTGAAGFNVVGVGDYNNDGTADIALQNGGTVVDWIMKNGLFQSGNIITTGATGFTVV